MIGRLLLRLVGFYSRAVSPALPPRCRFHPTCSAYAAEAIARHGAGRGSWLALRRLAKCAPWHPGGVDLVPQARDRTRTASGTAGRSHSSSTTAALPAPPADGARSPGDRSPEHATPPAPRRTPQEESSVA
jgi:putative membrane protein insertion efficiency factor